MNAPKIYTPGRPAVWLYRAALMIAVFSGLGQMPIYTRYYVSSIPGLTWSGNFWQDLLIHYLSALALLGLGLFIAVDFLLRRAGGVWLTASGQVRAVLLLGVILTGIAMLLKNLPSVNFSQNLAITMNLSHLLFTMAFLVTLLVCAIRRSPWATERPAA